MGYIFQRDLKGQRSDKKVIEREEALACLQVLAPSILNHNPAGGGSQARQDVSVSFEIERRFCAHLICRAKTLHLISKSQKWNEKLLFVLQIGSNHRLTRLGLELSHVTSHSVCISLQVRIGKDRLVTLGALRGSTRPVIIAGSKGQVSKTLKAAEPFVDALQERGISIIPVKISEEDSSAKLAALKEQFRSITYFTHLPLCTRLQEQFQYLSLPSFPASYGDCDPNHSCV